MEHDLRLQWPYRMLKAGSLGSGKSTLTTKLVSQADETMSTIPKKIILFYSHMKQVYKDWVATAPCPVQLLAGRDHLTNALTTPPGTLIVVDDMQATHANIISAWFTWKSHHQDTPMIHLVQNVFDKDPEHRTISLKATYIVQFKIPRDRSQVTHLDTQIYPGGRGVLTAAYKDATGSLPQLYCDRLQSVYTRKIQNTLFPDEDFLLP